MALGSTADILEFARHRGVDYIAIDGVRYPLVVADVDTGLLFFLAIGSMGVYGVMLAGWASNSKYSLLGGLRSSAQLISYEISMRLAVVTVFLLYDSVKLTDIVHGQTANPLNWGFASVPGLIAFVLFTVAIFAETNRNPFDLPEGESELVAGFHTEYSSFKFALFFMAEYANMIVMGTVIATLFLGGYHLPFLEQTGFVFEFLDVIIPMQHWAIILISITAFVLKVILVLFVKMTIRWTLPRFRYDQIMQLCWKLLLPLSLINILLTGVGILLFS